MEKVIGRQEELAKLQQYADSGKSEFMAVYGHRRVGKTFLVRGFFKDKFDFYVTGVIEGPKSVLLDTFNAALTRYGHKGEKAKTWFEAFDYLANLLERKSRRTQRRISVFIDEMQRRCASLRCHHLWFARKCILRHIFFCNNHERIVYVGRKETFHHIYCILLIFYYLCSENTYIHY